MKLKRILLGATALSLLAAPGAQAAVSLLNVSYDVTREFYKDVNANFATFWKQKAGEDVTIQQSHGGSTKQARSVIDGLEADVVTMNQQTDVDAIAEIGKLIPTDWRTRLPNNSAPYTSTIVFLVRKGNPKAIKDWNDLVKPGVSVVVPNPKTSGNGRYSYLAAYGYALKTNGNDPAKAKDFVGKLFKNVPVLDTGGRGASTTFVQRGIGDVLLTFESEVLLIKKDAGGEAFEPVVPSVSVEAEAPVAWVDKYVNKHGTLNLAKGYLEYLYSPAGQELAAKHYLRPRSAEVLAKYSAQFPKIGLFSVDQVFGSWKQAQKEHFADGGLFDQIYQTAAK
ncbi:MAG TPA: sulfate ABC transporter substrate-binding protein [bacterium]|nr:sulfate ABC transporter substrate-binding protein [bacterium]